MFETPVSVSNTYQITSTVVYGRGVQYLLVVTLNFRAVLNTGAMRLGISIFTKRLLKQAATRAM
jgi:hypothetical protein